MVLENGALLLLWNERLVHTVKDGDRTFEYSGCVVVYRAYISNEELLIEKVIEPEDTWSCRASGYFFVDDGQHINILIRVLSNSHMIIMEIVSLLLMTTPQQPMHTIIKIGSY
jgi:hypothetical protein